MYQRLKAFTHTLAPPIFITSSNICGPSIIIPLVQKRKPRFTVLKEFLKSLTEPGGQLLQRRDPWPPHRSTPCDHTASERELTTVPSTQGNLRVCQGHRRTARSLTKMVQKLPCIINLFRKTKNCHSIPKSRKGL